MFIPKRTLLHRVALSAEGLLQYGVPVRRIEEFCEQFHPQAQGIQAPAANEIRDLLRQESMADED